MQIKILNNPTNDTKQLTKVKSALLMQDEVETTPGKSPRC